VEIFRDLDKIPAAYKHAVIALGNFDGLHIGHRAILAKAKDIASAQSLPLAVMTFEPHPREFFSKDKTSAKLRIYSLRSKLLAIKALGVECIFLMRFNKKLTSLSAHDFIKDILVGKLQAQYIITGDNFYFGKDRQGDKNLLQQEAASLNFNYIAHPQIVDKNSAPVSSSNIRLLLGKGRIKEAEALLGQPYHIEGMVRHGDKRGGTIGFPTANISLNKSFPPLYGVYAVRVKIDGEGKIYNAIANLGTKPTFGVNEPILETHLFNTSQDLYGKRLCVEFVEFIREEKKFPSIDELKKQIIMDCDTAKTLLQKKM
jgi:riboflavin kinase/FMN adenylyltransferase